MRIFISLAQIIIFFFPYTHICSQQTLNLNFEKLSVEGIQRPWGWQVYSYAPIPFNCDSTLVKEGNYSLNIESKDSFSGQELELVHFIEPNQLIGKHLILKGWGKKDLQMGVSGVRLYSIGNIADSFQIVAIDTFLLKNLSEWQQFKLELDVSDHVHSVYVSLLQKGLGTTWYDDFELFVNNRSVGEIPVAKEFTSAQMAQIIQHCTPIKSVNPNDEKIFTSHDFSDLGNFKDIVGNAKLIALGESTHGTSEFFKVKHRLLQYAILEIGVRVFILEDNLLRVEKINNYVLTGEGNVTELMKGLFAVWNTEEMLQLIQWVRSYNKTQPGNAVEFVGMDIQNPQPAFEYLDQFLATFDPPVHSASEKLLAPIKKEWQNSYLQNQNTLNDWVNIAESNYNMIINKSIDWKNRAAVETKKIEWICQYARLIYQFAKSASTQFFSGRDQAMAENVEWILQQRPVGTKAIIWAHDSHISRGEAELNNENYFLGQSMGAHLANKYGDYYRAFGLFTYSGSCLGTISYSNFTQIPFTIYTSPKGTLDACLHKITILKNEKNLLLNLRPFKKQAPEFDWINCQRPVRYVGYVTEDYGFGGRYSIPYQFDGIVFIDQSTAAHKISD